MFYLEQHAYFLPFNFRKYSDTCFSFCTLKSSYISFLTLQAFQNVGTIVFL